MHSIDRILAICPHQVRPCHYSKAIAINQALQAGTPFTALGGKHLRSCKGMIRFKLCRELRLLYQASDCGYVPYALITRQKLERELKVADKSRRFKS